jgi:hypothetical protein
MNTSDRKGPAARKAVTERLRRFFAERTAQLAAGTAEIWSRVERQIAKKSPESEDAAPSGNVPIDVEIGEQALPALSR